MSVGWSFLSLDYNLTMLQSALENLLCLLTLDQKNVYVFRAILETVEQFWRQLDIVAYRGAV